LIPHLSQRRYIYEPLLAPDLRQIEYLFADKEYGAGEPYKAPWNDALTSPYFETLAEQDGYILKKRAPYVPAHPLAIQFDNRITLLGYTIEASLPARRGETVSLVVVWRADQAIHERYVIFMHLLDGQEHIWAQGDREPANGWFRTDRWEAGDVTPDRYWLELPAEMAVGDYAVAVGLYDPVTGVRLKTADGQDRLILTSVEVQ